MAYTTSLNSATRTASRNLNLFTQQQSRSISRLSSGTRVASPSDDPSALAIGSRVKSDKLALRQAQSNTRLASSMLQVASGGLESVLDTLTELRALTVRVTNGSLSASETSLVQEEFEVLRQQVDDIAAQTRFSDTSLLSGKGKIADAANKGVYINGNTNGGGAFGTEILQEYSKGFFKAVLPAQLDIDVRTDESNASALVADIKIGDHTFSLNTHALATGDTAVFKSDDGYTQFGIEVADVTNIDTRAELITNLQAAFSGASIAVGATVESTVDGTAASVGAAAGIQGINLDNTNGIIQGTTTAATVQGTQGDYTVSWEVGGETFRALGVTAAAGGRLDLVSTQNSGRSLSFDIGATYAGTDATALATALNNFVNAGTGTFNIGDSASGSGFEVVGTSFTATDGIDLDQSRGFFEGSVTDVSVKDGDSGHDISITLNSGQTLTARNFTAAAGGTMLFYDDKDASNVIGLSYSAAADLNTESAIQTSLSTHLGLDNGPLGVVFQSANSYQSGSNGFDASVNGSIKSTGSTYPGKWAFAYDADKQEFSLKNGEGTYRVKARDADSQVVTFGNGLAIAVGMDQNNTFDRNKSIDQVVFSTEDSSDGSFRFRVNTGVDDEVRINIGPATTKDLGLEGINVANMDSAHEAAAKVDAAMTLMNVALTSVGAQQSRIDAIDHGLQRQYNATATAEGILLDVDIGDELAQVSRLDVLSQTAAAMFSRAQAAPQRLTDLLLR